MASPCSIAVSAWASVNPELSKIDLLTLANTTNAVSWAVWRSSPRTVSACAGTAWTIASLPAIAISRKLESIGICDNLKIVANSAVEASSLLNPKLINSSAKAPENAPTT